MKKSEAIEILKQQLVEIQHVRELAPGNQEFKLWHNRVSNVIQAALDPDDRMTFSQAVLITIDFSWFPGDKVAQFRAQYLKGLDNYETALKSIIEKYELLGFKDERAAGIQPAAPKAFIAYGGESPARTKLSSFLNALGITPIIVEEQPKEGRSINENIDWYLKQCDCAIILATKGDIDGKTGDFIPRGNILIEVGRCQERLPNKTIYLLEEGAIFPSNVSEKLWERFTQDNMENAFIKTANELRAFGLIRATRLEQ
jgi:predicted nucleotide-binding protein